MNQADAVVIAGKVLTCANDDDVPLPRCGADMDDAGEIEEGAFAICGGKIAEVGLARDLLRRWQGPVLDYCNCTILPGFVDAHTHPIFAGSRADEYLMRAQGATYEDIHAKGGGIASTVRASSEASDGELEDITRRNLEMMLAHGSTTIEAKSGYGLSTREELRELRILRKLGRELPIDLAVTFLGAHAVPEEYVGHAHDYVKLLVKEMIPQVCEDGLADWIDVFCERGVFDVAQAKQILETGMACGLGARIHAEEFCYLGGAKMAASIGAASCDHLQSLQADDYPVLKESGIIPILTPGTSFFLGVGKYAKGREMIDFGLPVAVATDFNPGSNFCLSMPMAISLAVLRLKMTPAEAIVAATVNAAHSLKMADRVGSLSVGKQADFVVLNTLNWREWPYSYGVNWIRSVYKKGLMVA
ncbi:MAG: imidazolonepropionase [Candidatus Bruticola sp.]